MKVEGSPSKECHDKWNHKSFRIDDGCCGCQMCADDGNLIEDKAECSQEALQKKGAARASLAARAQDMLALERHRCQGHRKPQHHRTKLLVNCRNTLLAKNVNR
mmetsp:Transcript_25869/g.41429  ORF Transcript_25869/g.41429 Transcript_25869/m.41429 type:complete len:104 (+) Transcript_25869:893-1204(+)